MPHRILPTSGNIDMVSIRTAMAEHETVGTTRHQRGRERGHAVRKAGDVTRQSRGWTLLARPHDANCYLVSGEERGNLEGLTIVASFVGRGIRQVSVDTWPGL